jgi:hypothetical protein
MHPSTKRLSLLGAAVAAVACLTLAPLVADESPKTAAPAADAAKAEGCCDSCCCCGHGEGKTSCAKSHGEGSTGHDHAAQGTEKKGCC